MSHFSHTHETAVTTPSEWLRVGAEIGRMVNDWSLRSDLAVMLDERTDQKYAARYNPETAEVEVSLVTAFGVALPDHVSGISNRKVQYDYPQATGAIFHEACHARFSRYSLIPLADELNDHEFEALKALEETRCEGWGVRAFPDNRVFLRYSALDLALAEANDHLAGMDSVRSAAYLSALALARVDCGVLETIDTFAVREAIIRVLGEDTLEKLRSVWLRFQAHGDHSNSAPLVELAREWEQIVRAACIEQGQDPDKGQGGSGEMGFGDEMGEALGELLEALADDMERSTISAQNEMNEQQTAEEWKQEVEVRASAAKQQQQNRQTAAKIFDKIRIGSEPSTTSGSRMVERRKPTSKERAAAVKIGSALEKAKYRDRDVTTIRTAEPAGRLRARSLIQGKAYEARGVRQPVEAWSKKVRKQTDEPTLSLGVMVDISGSMGSAMNPMASTAWIMSEAVRRVAGRAAMVYYGSDVFPTLKAGQHLSEVEVYTAPDSTEKFGTAFEALDGALNLLNGEGARILVVVSDGQYTNEEVKKAKGWLRECQRNGVAVLWIGYGYTSGARWIADGTDTVVIDMGKEDVTASALAIGQAAIEAVQKTTVRKMA